MHVLFTELPKVTSDRLHLTDGETLEVAVDLQEFGLEVPTRRIERPRAPPRVRVQWMLVVTQVHRRQRDPLIGIEIPARPGQHVACPTREERLIRSLPGDPLICPLDRGSTEHPRRSRCHRSMLAKRPRVRCRALFRGVSDKVIGYAPSSSRLPRPNSTHRPALRSGNCAESDPTSRRGRWVDRMWRP